MRTARGLCYMAIVQGSPRLPWLPPAPTNFRDQCIALLNNELRGVTGAEVMRLATHQLDDPKAKKLGQVIASALERNVRLDPLSQLNLAVLSNATVDLLADVIPAAAARHGVAVSTCVAPFDQVIQQAIDPHSLIRSAGCDAILLLLDHHFFQLSPTELNRDAARDIVDGARAQLDMVVAGLTASEGNPTLILSTIATPPVAVFGGLDRSLSVTARGVIAAINHHIEKIAAKLGMPILDVATIAEVVGTENWFDERSWNAYKLPFSPVYAQDFSDRLGALLGAIRGKARKCLVLDLDNTLWSGVIGDDGVESIEIGKGTPLGEAHSAVQRYALELRKRGIILAVCSKNNDETAREPFRTHEGMLLKEDDITVFQANWVEKSTNIEAIAKSLNIGLDALVFLDDNPSERAHVRAALPMVAVPELPTEPSQYVSYLSAAGYFEALSFSQDDVLRADSYKANAQRLEVQAQSRDLGDYLSSLEMRLICRAFDRAGRARVAQLVNKSNQFHLTTRRYTEAQIEAYEGARAVMTLQARLADRFGDMGMIGVIICTDAEEDGAKFWDIDTWVMSCRVLGRNVEQAMLRHLVNQAVGKKILELRATYIPTKKNNMVREHYDRLGFTLLTEDEQGVRSYSFDTASYVEDDLYLDLVCDD